MNFFRDYIESFRYSNHLWPVFLLRLYVGFYLISESLYKTSMGFLEKPVMSALVDENLFALQNAPTLVKSFYLDFAQPNWLFWSQALINFEWLIGLLFVFGLLVRPAALLVFLYFYLVSYISTTGAWMASQQVVVMIVILMFLGAGRVGGLDYFFYKRQRGLIW